jgi:hypothetical protein
LRAAATCLACCVRLSVSSQENDKPGRSNQANPLGYDGE